MYVTREPDESLCFSYQCFSQGTREGQRLQLLYTVAAEFQTSWRVIATILGFPFYVHDLLLVHALPLAR